ncbi:MAG: hypothetical protein H0V16_02480 [Burkholderiaceae bacterium]|nr:hypothetical protein [Burkholderiaceae bacterium]
MTETEFQAECLRRFDRIEAMLEHLLGDTTGALLRQVARVVGSNEFVAAEVTALAETDTRLREALKSAIGLESATRRLGKLLARCEGRSMGGVLVARHGDSNVGGVWGVKLTLPLAAASIRFDHAGTFTERETHGISPPL